MFEKLVFCCIFILRTLLSEPSVLPKKKSCKRSLSLSIFWTVRFDSRNTIMTQCRNSILKCTFTFRLFSFCWLILWPLSMWTRKKKVTFFEFYDAINESALKENNFIFTFFGGLLGMVKAIGQNFTPNCTYKGDEPNLERARPQENRTYVFYGRTTFGVFKGLNWEIWNRRKSWKCIGPSKVPRPRVAFLKKSETLHSIVFLFNKKLMPSRSNQSWNPFFFVKCLGISVTSKK